MFLGILKLKLFFISLFFLLISNSYLKAYQLLYVNAKPGLNLREKPSMKSKVLQLLPYSSAVMPITGTETFKAKINGVRGKWIKVAIMRTKKSSKGWVFDSYLLQAKDLIKRKDFFFGKYKYKTIFGSGDNFNIELFKNFKYKVLLWSHGKTIAKYNGHFKVKTKTLFLYSKKFKNGFTTLNFFTGKHGIYLYTKSLGWEHDIKKNNAYYIKI